MFPLWPRFALFAPLPAPFNSSQKTIGVYPVGPGDRTEADLTGACPVQYRLRSAAGVFNRGGLPSSIPEGYLTGVQKTKTKRANSTPSPLLQLPGFEKEKML